MLDLLDMCVDFCIGEDFTPRNQRGRGHKLAASIAISSRKTQLGACTSSYQSRV